MCSLPIKNHIANAFYNIKDARKFSSGLQQTIDQVPIGGVFLGDNLITFHKSLSFLHDTRFMAAVESHASTETEKATIWRAHTLCWAALRALSIPGDFVECACYKGVTARIIADYVNFRDSGKEYFLYDLFEHKADSKHHSMPEHSAQLYAEVKRRFADLPNVHVTQGKVPEVLDQIAPPKISFLHLDLNNADAEIGALEILWDRLSPGAALVLDDYGWIYYQDQKIAEDLFFARLGYSVLELPTGQGLVIK